MPAQKIVPSLWCSGDPEEMFATYQRAFGDVTKTGESRYPEDGLLPFQKDFAGKILTIEFTVFGFSFLLVNGGPAFTPNPSVSFMVRFRSGDYEDPAAALRNTWEALLDGGQALMPLDAYDFGALFGWVEDKHGISWQLMLEDDPSDEIANARSRIHPALLFGKPVFGKALTALRRYQHVFPESADGLFAENPDGSLAFGDASFAGEWLAFQDSESADFTFNEGVSFVVNCDTQEEIDRYWAGLSRVPEAEQCGWCKDEFGVSWQITPLAMERLTATPEAYQAMMGMKKIDIAVLESFL